LKIATAEYGNLLTTLCAALGPERKPLLIGIDGKAGIGKTSLSNWLAWQLEMPAIHLDLFVIQNEVPAPIGRRVNDLDRCIKARGNRPMLIEGVLLLDSLDEVGRSPDFLIFVDEQPAPAMRRLRPPESDLIDTGEFSLGNQVAAYLSRRAPADRAAFRIKGF
jgi:thymidylate kinase